jgi:hypothetical protein
VEALKSLTDSLKVTVYELFAILFPGALLLEIARHMGFLPIKMEPLAYAGAAYATGLALQGLAAWRLGAREGAWKASYKGHGHAKAAAMEWAKTIRPGIQTSELLSYALSRSESRRGVYDKFVALRDMARGLMCGAFFLTLVLVVDVLVLLFQHASPIKILGSVGAAIATALATGGLAHRYPLHADR